MKWSVNSGLGYYFETILFIFLAFDFLSVLRGHSVFSSPPQRPMTSDFNGFYPRSYPLHVFPILNYIYFTTIMEQVIQLILIMLVGTDVCVRMVSVWKETGVPGGNPTVWLGDHMTISHADARYRSRVAAVRGECVNNAPARQPWTIYAHPYMSL